MQHEGEYFVSLNGASLENADNSLWSFIQDSYPPQVIEINQDSELVLKKGDYLYD